MKCQRAVKREREREERRGEERGEERRGEERRGEERRGETRLRCVSRLIEGTNLAILVRR